MTKWDSETKELARYLWDSLPEIYSTSKAAKTDPVPSQEKAVPQKLSSHLHRYAMAHM